MKHSKSIVALRAILGGIFAIAALYKGLNFESFVKAVANQGNATMMGHALSRAIAGGLVGLELAMAYFLLLGVAPRAARGLGTAFLTGISIASVPIVAKGESCQCMWRWVPLYVDSVAGLLARNVLLLAGIWIVAHNGFATRERGGLRILLARCVLAGLAIVAGAQAFSGSDPAPPQLESVPPPLHVAFPDLAEKADEGAMRSARILPAERIVVAAEASGNGVLDAAESLGGRVVSPAREPVDGVVVSCQVEGVPGGRRETTPTDHLGRFRFRAAIDAAYTLSVGSDGLMARPIHHAVAGEDYTLILGRGASIEGFVLDENGGGVGGAKVACVDVLDGTRRQLTSETRSDGRYSFTGLVAGRYQINTFPVRHRAASVDVSLAWGESREAGLTVEGGQRLQGVLVDAGSHAPIAGGLVAIGAAFTGKSSETDEFGRFVLDGLPPSAFLVLCARAEGYAEWAQPLRVSSDMPNLTIQLDRGAQISGRVVVAGSAVADARLLLVWTRSWQGTTISRPIESRSGRDGSFEFAGVNSDCVWTLSCSSGDRVAFVRSTDKVVDGVRGLVLELSPGTRIVGRVAASGEPTPATVNVAGDDWGPVQQFECGANGMFVSAAVPRGTYRVDAHHQLAAGAAVVDVVGEPEVNVAIALDASGSIRGRLVRGDGNPVGKFVVVASRDGSRIVADGRDGRFQLTGLAREVFLLEAWDTGDAAANDFGARAEDVAAGTEDLLLHLPEVQTLTGLVVRGTTPVADAKVCAIGAADRRQATNLVAVDQTGRFVLLLPTGVLYHVRIDVGGRSYSFGPLALPLAVTTFEVPQ